MKKILSLILALIMMLSCASMIFAEDTVLTDEAPVEVDETASAYYEAVQFLVAYDIMHGKGDGVLGVYDDIQRYEMALFMGRILTGWTDDSTWEDGTLNSSEFTDLAGTAADKYYGAISYVNQKGVIEGYGNGKFGPTDGITYQDALTMAVRALGYNGLAYPWGYIETAINLGLDDGITGVLFTDTLKREVVAQIIYNTLFATNKAGTTLAESVFDLSIAWTNIIITKTDIASGDVPAGYVGFSILYEDGTIGEETYYVAAADLGLVGEHDDELAWGGVYKVMFDTEAELGLNKVIAYESCELETIKNEGIYSMTTAGYPIQAFLADYDIVTNYSAKTYLNTTPEIILASADNILGLEVINGAIGVDWATGNILYFDLDATKAVWEFDVANWMDFNNVKTIIADPALAGAPADGGQKYGALQYGPDYCIVDKDTLKYPDAYVCKSCGGDAGDASQWYDFHDETYTCDWKNEVGRIVRYEASSEVLWYYNALIDSYFQLQLKETVNGVEIVGVVYMTAAERAELDTLLNTAYVGDWEVINKITKVETDADKLNAYASLRLFDITGDDAADYGVYEEYRFGIFYNTTVKCPKCNDGKGAVVPAYAIMDVSNTPINGATNEFVVASEAACAHDSAWLSGVESLPDYTYVIYGYNAATGELKIVKTITDTYEENEDDYIGHAYLRSYSVANNRLVLNGEKLSYNYPQLKGSITDAMLKRHNDWTGTPAGFLAIASRYLDTLLGQYIEYVVVDGKIAYIELEGASNNLIVVETYAGIHEDGTIVVWGYEVGADKDVTKLEQFRINSYNGWANGDWYNYSFYNEKEIEAAFTRGAVYQIKSYDPDVKAYNVQILTSAGENYNYAQFGTWTELYYADAKVGGMSVGAKAAGGEIQRKMASTDKYVFIYDIEGDEAYNAIPIVTYTGIVANPAAYAKGYRVGDTDGTYIMYIDDRADINGFSGAADAGYGLVMFLEWGTAADYDEANGKNYLVGSMVRTAWVFNLYTSRMEEITVYPGNYEKATWDSSDGTLGDGYKDNGGGEYVVIYDITGPVYQTVNGVLVNDEAVDAKDIPHIFEETIKGTDIIADANNTILETGTVIAKFDGKVVSRDQFYQLGYDAKLGGDYEGFCAAAINQRMTLKATGIAYKTLTPYTLYFKGKARVVVNLIKANDDGTASISYCGSNSDTNGDWARIAWDSMGKYADNAKDPYSVLGFFGDNGNDTQAYNYSLIYNSDASNTGAAKNDASRAVVYIHDMYNDPALNQINPTKSQVNGFDATEFGGEYPKVPLKYVNAASDDASALGLDNVVKYFTFEEIGDVAGKNGKGLDLEMNRLLLRDTVDTIESATFSIAFWMNVRSSKSDPCIFSTQCWDSGSNPGFGIYLNGDDPEIQILISTGSDRKDVEPDTDYTVGEWQHVAVTMDKATKTCVVYINGVEVESWTGSFDWNNLGGNDGQLTVGWDADLCYSEVFKGDVDNIVITSDVLTADEVANLAK